MTKIYSFFTIFRKIQIRKKIFRYINTHTNKWYLRKINTELIYANYNLKITKKMYVLSNSFAKWNQHDIA